VLHRRGDDELRDRIHRDHRAPRLAVDGSFFSAPRQADEIVPYEPATNLAQFAASLADAFDATVICAPARSLKTSWPACRFSAGVGRILRDHRLSEFLR